MDIIHQVEKEREKARKRNTDDGNREIKEVIEKEQMSGTEIESLGQIERGDKEIVGKREEKRVGKTDVERM